MSIKIFQKIGRFFSSNSENVMNNGKKTTQKIQKKLEQKPDEFIPGFADTEGMIAKRVKFYPEDIAKMEKMSVDERIKYKGELKKQRRYIVEEGQ